MSRDVGRDHREREPERDDEPAARLRRDANGRRVRAGAVLAEVERREVAAPVLDDRCQPDPVARRRERQRERRVRAGRRMPWSDGVLAGCEQAAELRGDRDEKSERQPSIAASERAGSASSVKSRPPFPVT